MLERIKAKIRGTLDMDQLIKDGLTVGRNFHAQEGVIIDPGHCWLIEIGDNVTLAPRAHILAHDASTKIPLGYTKVGLVTIGNNVFVGAGTIILPGVKIDDNVIIGAGSVVTRNLSTGVYCGNPCTKIMDYDEWVYKQDGRMQTAHLYGKEYIIGQITDEKKAMMKQDLKNGFGYIV